MAKISGAVTITGLLAPSDTNDTYPITDPTYGIDGLRNVADITERNSIPYDRRRLGMLVSIERSGSPQELDSNGNPIYDIYQLINEPGSGNNTSDSDWKLILDSTNVDQDSKFINDSTQLSASNPDSFRGKIRSLFQPKAKNFNSLGTNRTIGEVVFNEQGTTAIALIRDTFASGVNTNAEVREYTLSTAFDFSTATDTSNTYTLSDPNVRGIDMTKDGTRLYTIIVDSATIKQHNLSSGFDVTSATDSGNTLGTGLSGSKTVRVSNDGSKLYFAGVNSNDPNDIFQYTMSTPGDLSTANKDSQITLTQISTIKSFDFSDDGYILIAGDTDTQLFHKYTINTSFDLTSGITQINTAQKALSGGFQINLSYNGNYIYLAYLKYANVIQYFLTVPYDLNTLSYQGSSILSNSDTSEDLVFSFGGTKAYELDSTNQLIREIDLTIPYNVIDFTYNGNTFSTSSTGPKAISISLDGKKLYELGNSSDIVYEYDFGTPFDLSTLVDNGNNFDLAAELGSTAEFTDMEFHVYGTKMFILNDSNTGNSTVIEFKLSTSWDITSASYTGGKDITNTSTMFTFKSDGAGFFTSDQSNIYEYSLTQPWDIVNSDILEADFVSINTGITPNSLFLTYDYSKLYYTTDNDNAVYEGLLGIKLPNNLIVTGEGRVYHLGRDITYAYKLRDDDVKTISSDYTINEDDNLILVDANNNSVTITLPPTLSTFRKPYTIKKIDTSSNNVTFTATNSSNTTIEFGNNIDLTSQGDNITLQHNRLDWYSV